MFRPRSVFAVILAVLALGLIGVQPVRADPTITEYAIPTAGSGPYGIAAGPDGALWFTEFNGNKIGRITTAGVIEEVPGLGSGGGPRGLTVAYGALLFTDFTANKIAVYDPIAGFVGDWDIPTANSGPDGIAFGFNFVHLCFTEWSSNKIGVVVDHGIAEVALPTAGSGPTGITCDPSGVAWFTEAMGNRIGALTTSGILEWTVPTANSWPEGITYGPDGNCWFTEYGGNKIGKITPAGVISEYPIPTAASRPYGITVGPDGNLWFVENAGNKIGRITPAGVITEYPLPHAGSGPISIVAGPDGNMWFTEFDGNRIGRLMLPHPLFLPLVLR